MNDETLVRPVKCWYCSYQMHYSGQAGYEPEVRLTISSSRGEEDIYLHSRCWNDWQERRSGDDEYEAGYAHGARDALVRIA